jgi:hypothetical protein
MGFDYCLIVFVICSAAHQIELSLGLAGSFIERASSQSMGRVVIPGHKAYESVGAFEDKV